MTPDTNVALETTEKDLVASLRAELATARQKGAEAMREHIARKFEREAQDADLTLRVLRVNDRDGRRAATRKSLEAERAAKQVREVAIEEIEAHLSVEGAS